MGNAIIGNTLSAMKTNTNVLPNTLLITPQKWAMDKLNGSTGNQVMEPQSQYSVGAGPRACPNNEAKMDSATSHRMTTPVTLFGCRSVHFRKWGLVYVVLP